MTIHDQLRRIVAERAPLLALPADLPRETSLEQLDEIELTDLMMTVEDEMKIMLSNPMGLRSVGQLEDEIATQLEYLTRAELVIDGETSSELNAGTMATLLAGTAAWAHLQSGRVAKTIVEGFIEGQRAALSVLVHPDADGVLTLTVTPAPDNDYEIQTDKMQIGPADSIAGIPSLAAAVLVAYRGVHEAAFGTLLVAGRGLSVEIMADLRAPSEWVADDF